MPRGYVYLMTNRSRTLYVGVTNNLLRRVAEHKSASGKAFTARYKIDRLVWFEETNDIRVAIEGEKRIKGWTRARKIAPVEEMNPKWNDISADWTVTEAPSSHKVTEREHTRVGAHVFRETGHNVM